MPSVCVRRAAREAGARGRLRCCCALMRRCRRRPSRRRCSSASKGRSSLSGSHPTATASRLPTMSCRSSHRRAPRRACSRCHHRRRLARMLIRCPRAPPAAMLETFGAAAACRMVRRRWRCPVWWRLPRTFRQRASAYSACVPSMAWARGRGRHPRASARRRRRPRRPAASRRAQWVRVKRRSHGRQQAPTALTSRSTRWG